MASYQLAIARHQHVSRAGTIKSYYLIVDTDTTAFEPASREYADAYWVPLNSSADPDLSIILTFVHAAIFDHDIRRYRLHDELTGSHPEPYITYACPFRLVGKYHYCWRNRLQFALAGAGRRFQLEMELSIPNPGRYLLVSGGDVTPAIRPRRSHFLVGKAEVYEVDDEAPHVFYAGWHHTVRESDRTPEKARWFEETDLDETVCIAFTDDAVERVGCFRAPHKSIPSISYLLSYPDGRNLTEADASIITAALLELYTDDSEPEE